MARHLRFIRRAALLVAIACCTSPARCVAAVAFLHWTAPGDDGAMGTATRYDVRRSRSVITPANFNAAEVLAGPPAPLVAGTEQSFPVDVPSDGQPCYFALRTVDEAGNWSLVSNIAIITAPLVSTTSRIPSELSFAGPWPNPSRQQASLQLSLPETVDADIEVYDVTGRQVRTLWSGVLEAGVRTFAWDLRDDQGVAVAPGAWFVRARCGRTVRVRRVIVAR